MVNDPTDTTDVTVTVADGIGRVTIDSGVPGNRLDFTGLETLRDHFLALARVDDVHQIVLKGSGRDFCAGRQPGPPPEGMTRRDLVELVFATNAAIAESPAITIAQVHGRALGLGCGLAVTCDLTIASADAVLGFPEIHHGFAPAIVISYLDRLVSAKMAMDLVVTGREITGDEASALGLVTRVVADDALDDEVETTIEGLQAISESALREAKLLLRTMPELGSDARVQRAIDSLVADE